LIAFRVSTKGTREADFDAKTWPELYRLALTTPEAGVHLQGVFDDGSSSGWIEITDRTDGAENVVYNREEDAQSATAQWFSGLLSSQPWFSDVVPDVC
jgi:D-amino-acid oxidase